MKKRKELDALVTNGSRTKLPKKKSMQEEGHELLLNIESDSGSSLDLDFSPPKRTFVRKPHVCSLCLSGCVLVLLVASILLSIALLWMNFDLKKDVDGLRKRLELVETVSGTSKSQLDSMQALINGLEKNFNDSRKRLTENIQRMDLKLLDINSKVVEVNTSSLALKGKVLSLMPQQQTAADGPQLQKVVAGLGSEVQELKGTVQDVQSSQKHQQEEFQSLSKNVADLKTTVTNMDLSHQPQASSQPPQEVPTPATPLPVNSKAATNPPHNSTQATGSTVVTMYLEQELKKLSDMIGAVNASLFTVEQEQTRFSERLQIVEVLSHNVPSGVHIADDNSSVSLVDMLKLQSDVKTLMAHAESVNGSIINGDIDLHDIITIRAQIADLQLTVNTLTNKMNQLNTPNLNNNLLNLNTTLGIQTIMTNSLQKFKVENLANFNDITYNVNQVQMQIQDQQEAINDLERQIEDMHRLVVEVLNTNKQSLVNQTKKTANVTSTSVGSLPASSTYDDTSETVTDTYNDGLEAMTTDSVIGEVAYPSAPALMSNSSEPLEEANLPPPFGYLEHPSIKTIEDLQARFKIWDMDEDGFVKFEDMPDFMGSYYQGTAQLEQFDYNRDSQLSYDELSDAFGFTNASDDVHNRRRIQEGSVSSDTQSGE